VSVSSTTLTTAPRSSSRRATHRASPTSTACRARRSAARAARPSRRSIGDLTDHSTAEYIAKTTNSGNSFEVVADPTALNGYDPQIVGAGIVASNQALATTVQKALQGLIDDKTYGQIIAKYGLLPVTSAQVNQGSKPVSTSPTP
jgi:hypothetical protein